MTFLTAFFVLLAVTSKASPLETLAVRVLALLAVLATAMLCRKWVYAAYFFRCSYLQCSPQCGRLTILTITHPWERWPDTQAPQSLSLQRADGG